MFEAYFDEFFGKYKFSSLIDTSIPTIMFQLYPSFGYLNRLECSSNCQLDVVRMFRESKCLNCC